MAQEKADSHPQRARFENRATGAAPNVCETVNAGTFSLWGRWLLLHAGKNCRRKHFYALRAY